MQQARQHPVNQPARDNAYCSAETGLSAAESALRKVLSRRDDKVVQLAIHNASQGSVPGLHGPTCPVRRGLRDDIEAMERVIEHLERRVSALKAARDRLQGARPLRPEKGP